MKDTLTIRLQRLLVLVPYVAAHPKGVPVPEVLKFAGYASEPELLRDVEMLNFIGAPPEGPGDLIEIWIDAQGVHVALPQGFKRPPRLSAVEVAALLAAAEPLREASGEVLRSALEKLERALPPGSAPALQALVRTAAIEASPPPPCRAVLEEAVKLHLEVEGDYWAASRAEKAMRRLQPHVVSLSRGQWYLLALDTAKNEERLYRLDRFASVRITDRTFPAPTADWSRFEALDTLFFGEHPTKAEIKLSPGLARSLRESFGDNATDHPDGSVTVRVPLAGEAFLAAWILSLGGDGHVEQPESLKNKVVEVARKLRERYETT